MPDAPAILPARGQVVRVRHRQYLVEDVEPSVTPADSPLVRLACLDDDAQGQPLEVLWDLEPDAEVLNAAGWDHVAARGFDAPGLFAAYVHTLRWNCVTAANPRLLQAPFRAGIKLDAYQIEPLRKALLLPRVNLFIADDVGLGKTIEAGLIARELLLRKKVRDVVVACPPSILPQWQDELETRFGLTFQVLDREYVLDTRRERGYATNPWATHTRFLISHRLLIDEQYAGPMRDWLGEFRAGSLLILDEAHHAAPAGGTKYAIDSKITRAVRDLAPRFEHRLFLSATPHNGHSNSFSALLEILDPQRFCRGVPVKDKKVLEAVMVRRLKEDIRSVQGGFPERKVVQIDIDGLPTDAPELRLSELLDRYRTYWEERLKDASDRKRAVGMLLVSGLQQRLLSSVEAFARTLKVHRATVERHRDTGETKRVAPGLYDLIAAAPGADDDRAAVGPEELGREEETQVEAATEAAMSGTAAEGMRPDHLAVVAEAVLAARAGRPATDDAVELVWTGPETAGVANRDTAVVVRELFAQAAQSVVVAGFAVYQGREVFRSLAERLAACAGLHARLYLDVHRGHQDTSPDSELLRRFARRFVERDWPTGFPLPEVYFDPRSLATEATKRSSLHAKCVVVDRRVAFVTSANFTEAAQERNIEAGVVVRSPRFAARLADHFGALADAGLLKRIALPDTSPTASG